MSNRWNFLGLPGFAWKTPPLLVSNGVVNGGDTIGQIFLMPFIDTIISDSIINSIGHHHHHLRA